MDKNIAEKGDELMKKFFPLTFNSYDAIKAAITAAEEIINVVGNDNFYAAHIMEGEKFIDQQEFWPEVLNYLKSKL